jgi:hypothetical protein
MLVQLLIEGADLAVCVLHVSGRHGCSVIGTERLRSTNSWCDTAGRCEPGARCRGGPENWAVIMAHGVIARAVLDLC